VRKALASVPGVQHVEVDFPNKQAVVIVKKDGYNAVASTKALEDSGFGGEVKQ